MPLSWNEIRHRAIRFAREWQGETREAAERQTFWNEFFDVFGIRRRTVASFEEPVRKLSGHWGAIDLFWPGVLLVEHKSAGADLGRARSQAMAYIRGLVDHGRHDEVPRYILVSDFARLALHDLEEQRSIEFPLVDLPSHVHDLAFIPGYKQHRLDPEDPVNFRAVEIMGELHDALETGGYTGDELGRFLIRVLFCLFAEDTGIFERKALELFIENATRGDGSDLGARLAQLFEVLNTPAERRQRNLDETLAALPYVNGDLFAGHLKFADFNAAMRAALLRCCRFDWSRISPAVFGSLFQAVTDPKERRQIGGHYTSERDILKVVRALFLDDLRAEYERAKRAPTKNELKKLHRKLGSLRFLDPACGCGNFLVVTYRELRRLEMDVLLSINGREQGITDIDLICKVDVDAMHGIEISDFPARIAEVALWLADHQMNLELSRVFGQYFVRLPLKKSPRIVHGNALRLDWKDVLPPEKCSYVLGNPPFVGKQFMTTAQSADMETVCRGIKNRGLLDYVTAWYFKAGEYIKDTPIRAAFVSTNSITQGEQVGILWQELFARYQLKIHFAYRTFPWESEARGKAHVHVVIIGFASFDSGTKRLYEVEADRVGVGPARNISPYLIEGSDAVVVSRSKPLCNAPRIVFGSMPNDGGHLLLNEQDRQVFLSTDPGTRKVIERFVGSVEFLNDIPRWCLWLEGVPRSEICKWPHVLRRVEAVRKYRLDSKRDTTRRLASSAASFGEIRQPKSAFLLIPSVSSINRPYIPMGFMPPSVIASNLVLLIPKATTYHFGVLTSAMHMAWVRVVCGRLKSDYRYSNKLVYNNFPWPLEPTAKQRKAVEAKAQAVLDVRKQYPGDSLAQLYDSKLMPPKLLKAHRELDTAVERCYRPQRVVHHPFCKFARS